MNSALEGTFRMTSHEDTVNSIKKTNLLNVEYCNIYISRNCHAAPDCSTINSTLMRKNSSIEEIVYSELIRY